MVQPFQWSWQDCSECTSVKIRCILAFCHHRAAKVVLFSVLFVCLSVCMFGNTITSEPRNLTASSYGRKGGQVRKWLYRGARVVIKRLWCSSFDISFDTLDAVLSDNTTMIPGQPDLTNWRTSSAMSDKYPPCCTSRSGDQTRPSQSMEAKQPWKPSLERTKLGRRANWRPGRPPTNSFVYVVSFCCTIVMLLNRRLHSRR